jgi:hypothetical protein
MWCVLVAVSGPGQDVGAVRSRPVTVKIGSTFKLNDHRDADSGKSQSRSRHVKQRIDPRRNVPDHEDPSGLTSNGSSNSSHIISVLPCVTSECPSEVFLSHFNLLAIGTWETPLNRPVCLVVD